MANEPFGLHAESKEMLRLALTARTCQGGGAERGPEMGSARA
jgi:hypothetical protein